MRFCREPRPVTSTPQDWQERLAKAHRALRCQLLPLPQARHLPQHRLGNREKHAMTTINQKIAALRQAAIDAAVELDWTKNEDGISPEIKERADRIVKNVFAACEALDKVE